MRAAIGVGLLCAALVWPARASGQAVASTNRSPRPRTWEFAGTIDVQVDPQQMLPLQLQLDLGHRWTTRWKTDTRITAGRERAMELETAVLPGGRSSVLRGTIGPLGVSTGATYEFRDRTATRPYASIGLDVVQCVRSRETDSAWRRALAVEPQRSSVLVRPFVAAGFKTYVGHSRAFMRSETLVAVEQHAVRHAVFRIGAGIDF